MATYIELRSVFDDDAFKNRVDIATVISANDLNGSTPTLDDQKWIASVLKNPHSEGALAVRAVIAANKDATLANITGATDAQIQTNVDAIRPTLVAAFNA